MVANPLGFAVDKLPCPNTGCRMTNSDPSSPLPPPTPKKHGCFFYGCITGLVLHMTIPTAPARAACAAGGFGR